MFHAPPDSPFLDSAGHLLQAGIHSADHEPLAVGVVGSLSTDSMVLQVDFLDGSFSGFVAYSHAARAQLWRPMLVWSEITERWEAAPFPFADQPHWIAIEEAEGDEEIDDP